VEILEKFVKKLETFVLKHFSEIDQHFTLIKIRPNFCLKAHIDHMKIDICLKEFYLKIDLRLVAQAILDEGKFDFR